MTAQAEREALAASILADARERAEGRRATNPAAAGTIMHYAKLKAERLLADGTRLQFGRDARDLDGNPRRMTQRACLRCRKGFDSAGPGNRLCGDCRVKAADASPYAV